MVNLIPLASAATIDYLPTSNLTREITTSKQGVLATFLQPIVSNLPLVTGIAALFIFLFAGLRYISFAGNPDETKKAANTMTYALIGLVLSVLAFWLTRILFQTSGGEGLF